MKETLLTLMVVCLICTCTGSTPENTPNPVEGTCTARGCVTTLKFKFNSSRSQKYSLQLKTADLTVTAKCEFLSTIQRWEAADHGVVFWCSANEITLFGSGFENSKNVSIETFDASEKTVELKDYALNWQGPYYTNGEKCDKGYGCYSAEIQSTAP